MNNNDDKNIDADFREEKSELHARLSKMAEKLKNTSIVDEAKDLLEQFQKKDSSKLLKEMSFGCGHKHLIPFGTQAFIIESEDMDSTGNLTIHVPSNSDNTCTEYVITQQAESLYKTEASNKFLVETIVPCHLIVSGPQGTVNKYFMKNSTNKFLISLAKNFSSGVFKNIDEAYQYSNELIFQVINELFERVIYNNIQKMTKTVQAEVQAKTHIPTQDEFKKMNSDNGSIRKRLSDLSGYFLSPIVAVNQLEGKEAYHKISDLSEESWMTKPDADEFMPSFMKKGYVEPTREDRELQNIEDDKRNMLNKLRWENFNGKFNFGTITGIPFNKITEFIKDKETVYVFNKSKKEYHVAPITMDADAAITAIVFNLNEIRIFNTKDILEARFLSSLKSGNIIIIDENEVSAIEGIIANNNNMQKQEMHIRYETSDVYQEAIDELEESFRLMIEDEKMLSNKQPKEQMRALIEEFSEMIEDQFGDYVPERLKKYLELSEKPSVKIRKSKKSK